MNSARRVPRAFGHVETWVFDLDNTLYPHHLNLWQQVDERIRDYIAREDLARNLVVPHALGMTTVLVVPEHTREVFREDWELEGREAPHVDHVTDDLVGFLEAVTRSR
jgi:FMN phosphatase YigB (HAD superfamily)